MDGLLLKTSGGKLQKTGSRLQYRLNAM